MKTISTTAFLGVLFISMMMVPVAQATLCSSLANAICTLLPCNALSSSLWSCGHVPGAGNDVDIIPSLLNVKLFIGAPITWKSLDLDGGATLTINAGVTLTIDGDVTVAAGALLEIEGTLVVQGKLHIEGLVKVHAGALVTIDADLELAGTGLCLNIDVDAVVTCNGAVTVNVGASIFVAVGAHLDLKLGALIYGTIDVYGLLTADVTVTVKGILRVYIDANIEINALLVIDVDALVDIKGAICVFANVEVSGLLKLSVSAQVTITLDLNIYLGAKVIVGDSCTLLVVGVLICVGDLNINVNAVLNVTLSVDISGKLIIGANAEVCLLADVTVSGLLSVQIDAKLIILGIVSITGNVKLNACIALIYGHVTVNVGGRLILQVSASVQCLAGITVNIGAVVNIGTGCLLVIDADSFIDVAIVVNIGATLEITGGVTECTVPLHPKGTVIIHATLDLGVNVYVQVDGVLQLAEPTAVLICATVTIKAAAQLIGVGHITAKVIVYGILYASADVDAVLKITGDLVLKATATVLVEIKSLLLCSKLVVEGKVTLAGALQVLVDVVGVLAPGSSFAFLTLDAFVGAFAFESYSPVILALSIGVPVCLLTV